MASILSMLAAFTLIICVVFILFHLKKFLAVQKNHKELNSRSEKQNQLLTFLDDIIETVVIAAKQKGSTVFKNPEEFSQLERDEALEEIKSGIYSIMHDKELMKLSECFGCIDEWIHDRVEFYLRKYKPE